MRIRGKTLLQLVIVGAVAIGLAMTIGEAWEQIAADPNKRNLLWHARWQWLTASLLLYGLGLLPAAYYWTKLLGQWDIQVTPGRGVASHLLGQLGKYVPGKAMVIVLRVGGVVQNRQQVLPATVTVFVETLTMMAVGAAWAGGILVWVGNSPWLSALAASLVFASVLPTLPPIFRVVLRRLLRSKLQTPLWQRYQAATFAQGWLWLSLSWWLIGGSFAAIVHALVPEASSTALYLAAAAMALAVVAGFVSLLPGGAGVREWILITIMEPHIGAVTALTAAILARLLFILAEALMFGVSKLVLHRVIKVAQEVAIQPDSMSDRCDR